MSQSIQVEVVGVYDAKYRAVFPEAVTMQASINEEAKMFTHPLEDGVSVADHRIIMPVEIELTLFLRRGEYRDVYAQIRNEFYGANTYIVQTRTNSYPNMAISSMPHEESPEMFDTVPLTLKFVEAQFVKTQFQALPPAKVRNKRDASTVKRGEQQGKKSSILYDLTYGKPKKQEGK